MFGDTGQSEVCGACLSCTACGIVGYETQRAAPLADDGRRSPEKSNIVNSTIIGADNMARGRSAGLLAERRGAGLSADAPGDVAPHRRAAAVWEWVSRIGVTGEGFLCDPTLLIPLALREGRELCVRDLAAVRYRWTGALTTPCRRPRFAVCVERLPRPRR